MVTIASLWLPILISAVVVWIVSSVVWMVLPWHRKDFQALPNEETARNALKGVPRGQYHVPHCPSRAAMKDPEYQRKLKEGPLAIITIQPTGIPSMARPMIQWMVFNLLAAVVIAYVASRTMAPGSEYLAVFRIVGVTAWLTYGAASVQEAIWFGRPWRAVLGLQIDALIYALLVAGIFGSMWP